MNFHQSDYPIIACSLKYEDDSLEFCHIPLEFAKKGKIIYVKDRKCKVEEVHGNPKSVLDRSAISRQDIRKMGQGSKTEDIRLHDDYIY